MSSKRLIKTFEFTTRSRRNLTFSSDKIRLNDDLKTDQGLTLSDLAGPYDLGLGHTVTTWITSPKALKKWLMFDADELKPAGTTIGYRLILGAAEVYWDGAAWSAATTDAHWNTMSQVNQNIQSLVLTGFDLQVKVNLRTTDQNVTPKVRWIKILVLVDIEQWDDLIYDTVIRSMKSTLRPTTVYQAAVVANTTVIDLGADYKSENSGYNFTGVKAAYNLTTDPNKFKNIAQSYTPGVARADGAQEDGQVTLTEQIDANQIICLEMEYEPEIAVYTGQDYYEPDRLPAVVFESIDSVRLSDRNGQELNDGEGDAVRDLVAGTAVIVPRPRQTTVRFDFAIHASPLDLARLTDAVDKWISSNRLLRSWGFDETLNMDAVNEINTNDTTNIEDTVMSTGSFQLRAVPFYVRDSEDGNLVTNLNLNLIP